MFKQAHLLGMKNKLRMLTGEPGFTIVELLVTIVVIAALTSIAVPALMNHHQKAQDARAKQNLKNVSTGLYLSQRETDKTDWSGFEYSSDLVDAMNRELPEFTYSNTGKPSGGPDNVDIEKLTNRYVKIAVRSESGIFMCASLLSTHDVQYASYSDADDTAACKAQADDALLAAVEGEPVPDGSTVETTVPQDEDPPTGETGPTIVASDPTPDPDPEPESEPDQTTPPEPVPTTDPPPVINVAIPEVGCGKSIAVIHSGALPAPVGENLPTTGITAYAQGHSGNFTVVYVVGLFAAFPTANIDCFSIQWFACPLTGSCTYATRLEPEHDNRGPYNEFGQAFLKPSSVSGGPKPTSGNFKNWNKAKTSLSLNDRASQKICARISIINASGESYRYLCATPE